VLRQRYIQAARLTAPKIAAATPAAGIDGYWLSDTLYYFLAERMDSSRGRMVAVPSIADCSSGKVVEVIPLQSLLALLAEHSGKSLDVDALSRAELDMRDKDTLTVSIDGKDYLIDVRTRRVVSATDSLGVPALYSPDGRYACIVRGYDLWLKERDTGDERPLTSDGAPHCCYGQESETNLSAVSYRKRPQPVGLWSPDSQWFLTQRVDERSLPEMALVENAPPGGGRPVLHRYKYALPGDPLPVVTYVAIHIPTGRVTTFDDFPVPIATLSPFGTDRVWFGHTQTAWFLHLDRYCKQANLVMLDLRRGAGRVVLSETAASGYLDLSPRLAETPNVRTLSGSEEAIWFSERDGWGHLYLYDTSTGKLKNQITRGEWLVTDIVHVDEQQRRVLFLAAGIETNAEPARRVFCAANLDGTGFEVLLNHDGDIFVRAAAEFRRSQTRPFRPQNARVGISPDLRFGIVRYASVQRGNVTEVVDLRTKSGFAIAAVLPSEGDVQSRYFTSLAADGVTQLHGVMFLPPDFDESRRYPLIDYIYPGPQVVQQPQSYNATNSAPAKALAALGFVTIMLDTRGMPMRSWALHQVGYGELLEPQLADHAAVVRALCAQRSFIDAERVGMIGHSGGGAATARAMFDYGDTFKVGVSVCGNHNSSLYATLWSDKYRGDPGTPRSWPDQANGAVAHKLSGKLLLISGDMDENVHVSHTLALADALIRANKDFDLLIVPNAGHLVMMTSGYAQRRIWDYFVRNLLHEEPPANFELKFEPWELDRYAKRTEP